MYDQVILSIIFFATGAATRTIGLPNTNASKNERGQISMKFEALWWASSEHINI